MNWTKKNSSCYKLWPYQKIGFVFLCIYRISPPMSPGLIRVRKAFLMGLSAGGLICGGGLYVGQKRQVRRLTSSDKMKIFTWKNEENVLYYSSIYSLNKICTLNRTFLAQKSESTHSFGKAYAHGGGGGGGVTKVLRKMWAYLRGWCYTWLIGGEIRYTLWLCRLCLWLWSKPVQLIVIIIFLSCLWCSVQFIYSNKTHNLKTK